MPTTNHDGPDRLQLLTVAEVAGLLRISKSLVYGLVESGRLPASRLGKGRGAIRIKSTDVEVFVDESRVQSGEAARPRPRPKEKLRHIKL
jgi:excisionase family DNA binding protein